ncbi:MAG: 3-deoxy-7-phosphoheptulonate synthase [Bacteroidia bacterium]|nr:3-deoxy-7-phosphoheptulonate synthase [Bacteroidia bacterium]
MIIHIKDSVAENEVQTLADKYKALQFKKNGHYVLVTSSSMKSMQDDLSGLADDSFVFDSDIQLASDKYKNGKREIRVGDVVFGGDSNNTVVITGPCSVESEAQIRQCAELCVELGIKILRAGAYKPRTSPYSFQGMGLDGLKLLAKMRSEYGLKIITEVRDATQVHEVIEYADIVQVGAKAMYDNGILRACAKSDKAVLIKRGFGSTLQEFVQAAEFVLSGGNENVMLCERGIRTFETKSRFTLDLCGVEYLKMHTNLPVIVDPSHAMGYRYGVANLARAACALGVDGLLIEAHPNPAVAKSDASQQLDLPAFKELYKSLQPIASAVNKSIA